MNGIFSPNQTQKIKRGVVSVEDEMVAIVNIAIQFAVEIGPATSAGMTGGFMDGDGNAFVSQSYGS